MKAFAWFVIFIATIYSFCVPAYQKRILNAAVTPGMKVAEVKR